MARLLVIAEKALQFRKRFEEHDHQVTTAQTGGEGEMLASSAEFDAIVLDLAIPDIDGVQIVKKLRRDDVSVPILLLSERFSVDQRINALAEGADDYLTKPIQFPDLLLRLETLLRRKSVPSKTTLSYEDLEINLLTRTIKVKGQTVHMPSRPFALLSYLVKHQEEVVSREKLARDVWSDESVVGKNVIEVYINQTRARFAELGHPLQLQTIRGKGYRLGHKRDGQQLS